MKEFWYKTQKINKQTKKEQTKLNKQTNKERTNKQTINQSNKHTNLHTYI